MIGNQTSTATSQIYYHINGTVCLIGHGCIGKGFIPMLKRHFTYDRFVIIDPVDVPQEGICDKFYQLPLTPDNYIKILDEIFGTKKGFCVNLSVGTSSKQITEYCQSKGILYIDTVKQEWQGFYENQNLSASIKSNYGLRHVMLQSAKEKKYKTTAISCCGANPGMVSWFVKKALLDIAKQVNFQVETQPQSKQEWAKLMMNLGVKGIHIAERDTQTTTEKRPLGHFWNTWSVDGFISEGFYQPAEMGWGSHEKWTPSNARQHEFGNKSGIYLMQPGMNTTIKSWCPTPGAQLGFLITHDESISISDYYTVQQNGQVLYRPTVMYAYHPTEDAISSCFDLLGSGQPPSEDKWKILDKEIVSGSDQLGVLIYGHGKNAYWYGSQLSIDRARQLISNQSATALQVTSAILAGMVWAIENPQAGLVETNEMDYKRCLQIQRPYIEPLLGVYTDWTPLKNTRGEFQNDAYDYKDAWQFKNMLSHK